MKYHHHRRLYKIFLNVYTNFIDPFNIKLHRQYIFYVITNVIEIFQITRNKKFLSFLFFYKYIYGIYMYK